MFKETSNPYRFQYLVTGISGTGIEQVYLPDVPKDTEILYSIQQKWVRPEPEIHISKALKEYAKKVQVDKNYIHPLQSEINRWADQEWKRSEEGVWFWNNGTPTFLTPFYIWYLSSWLMYFGYAEYRETDKEITYLLQFCEEDPECYGLLLNTIRRYGKSSLMGAWAVYRTIKNFNHYTGMQGEKDEKIEKFYRQMIKNPFKKLPFYHLPTYNTNSTLASDIRFEEPSKRGKDVIIGDYEEDEELGSVIEYRPSGAGEYDQAVLHTFLCEEPGKTLQCNINDRWKTVKPCLSRGKFIRGKAFMGTTVEFMDVSSKGGRAYKKLFYESDYNQKQANKRTKSGLYAAFLPGDCAYEGFFDEWGHPMRADAKKSLLIDRDSCKDNPKDHSDLIRKYPIYIKEIFHVNVDRCEFNAAVLQDRKSELEAMSESILVKGEFYWVDNKRFGTVRFRANQYTGWSWVHSLINDPKETSLVQRKLGRERPYFAPLNDSKFVSGVDPVDHGVVVEGKGGDEEYVSTRRSKPVLFVKRKYDSSIDGILSQDIALSNAKEKFQYKTNRYVAMMDVRPGDPNVFFERALMMMWYFGCSLHAESQKPGIMNYFIEHGCGDFILQKYVGAGGKATAGTDGTPASGMTISEYTDALATYIEYFGHTIPFIELVEDLLVFNPKKTTEFDYSVAAGFTELADKIKPKTYSLPTIDIHDFMPGYDSYGNVVQ